MAKRVYFAFHYQNDIWRVNQVRNSDITKKDREQAGFYDNSLWESAKKTGDEAIKRMILNGLGGSSVTAFLLGAETARRPWVRYELEQSWNRGNGLLSIHIHGLCDRFSQPCISGPDILDEFHVTLKDGSRRNLSAYFPTYNWVSNNGYLNFGSWVEESALIAQELKRLGIMP